MRRAITLYEVVLALAIFSGSIAAISQGLAVGTRAALQSRLQSQAILLCESKLAEVMAGSVPPSTSAGMPFQEPDLAGWTWSVNVKPGPRTGLISVAVAVSCDRSMHAVDASFSLIRLVRDQQAFLTNSTATGSTTSTSSTSTSGTSSGQQSK